MRLWKFPSSFPGHFVTAVTVSFLAMGPAGCNGFRLPGVPSLYSGGNPLGFLINSDTDSNVLGGIRLADGSSVYVFGTFQENGNIEKITGAAVRDTDGNEASIIFEDGRPTKARGFDGSTLEITYDEVGIERLKGHVDLYFAGENVAEEDRNQTIAMYKAEVSDLKQQLAECRGERGKFEAERNGLRERMASVYASITLACQEGDSSRRRDILEGCQTTIQLALEPGR